VSHPDALVRFLKLLSKAMVILKAALFAAEEPMYLAAQPSSARHHSPQM
jgi:hypothetical protein